MTTTKFTETNWYPDKRLLVTHISGELDKSDIEKWEKGFKNKLASLEDDTSFKILVDMYGFKAIDLDAHKRFRDIIPLTLADYGWKVGYLDLFEEEAGAITFKSLRGLKCVGAAHTHQDATKMDLYETRFSRNREHFFSDPVQARQWIEDLIISG